MEKLDASYDGIYQYPEIVREYWQKEKNYLIEYNEQVPTKEWCAVYFCSNDIWFPHTEEMFRKRIVERNFFEWYRCRIDKAYKHIFVRDVFKQWYLTGINGEINTEEKLLGFLRYETHGYKVVTIGSSAGGYASALFGPKLCAEQAICFNAQFSLDRLVRESTLQRNPLLFSMLKKSSGGARNVLLEDAGHSQIFYVYSDKSPWDIEQHLYAEGVKNVRCIEFSSSRHGIPFLKVALPSFINMAPERMARLANGIHNPILFTIHSEGLFKTLEGFVRQVYLAYKKRR